MYSLSGGRRPACKRASPDPTTSPKADYEQLSRAADEARIRSEQALLALE